jgi:hypothetical protein
MPTTPRSGVPVAIDAALALVGAPSVLAACGSADDCSFASGCGNPAMAIHSTATSLTRVVGDTVRARSLKSARRLTYASGGSQRQVTSTRDAACL